MDEWNVTSIAVRELRVISLPVTDVTGNLSRLHYKTELFSSKSPHTIIAGQDVKSSLTSFYVRWAGWNWYYIDIYWYSAQRIPILLMYYDAKNSALLNKSLKLFAFSWTHVYYFLTKWNNYDMCNGAFITEFYIRAVLMSVWQFSCYSKKLEAKEDDANIFVFVLFNIKRYVRFSKFPHKQLHANTQTQKYTHAYLQMIKVTKCIVNIIIIYIHKHAYTSTDKVIVSITHTYI